MTAGRPLKWQNVEELQEQIDSYFSACALSDEPLTITGLALALETTRKTLLEYQEREEFVNAINKAKSKVENYAEKRLFIGQPTGPIFALKNFGWSDKQELDVGGQKDNPIEANLTVTFVAPK